MRRRSHIAALIMATLTGCATPQHSREFMEGRQYGQAQIEATRDDTYIKFVRAWNAIHGWFVFQW